MEIENYKFPGWDRGLRCLCHSQDNCPDLEYLYSLQEGEVWWASLSDEERRQIETEAAKHTVDQLTEVSEGTIF